jgi:outer membrane protein assembly complex protein YaeT
VPEDVLRTALISRPRASWRFWRTRPALSTAALDEDMDRIARVYRDRGYYESTARYELAWDDEHDRADVTVHVHEGDPVRIAGVRVEVAPATPPLADGDAGAIAADLPLRPGEVFTLAHYKEARALLLQRLADRARPTASVEGGAEVDVAALEARVHWRVEPGPRVLFGPVRVTGLEGVGEHVVRRELQVQEGEPYSSAALERTRSRLLALRLFRYVSVLPQREGPAPATGATALVWSVVVELRERPPRSIALGGGWASDEGLRGSVRWTHRNFVGDARRLEIAGQGSEIEQTANVRLLQPYVLGTRAALESGVGWERKSRSSYDANTVDFRIGPRRSFGDLWVGEATYRFGWAAVGNVRDTTNEVLREQRDSGLLSGVGLRFRRATIDPLATRQAGTWLELGAGTNLRALGSDFDWMSYEADLRAILPLGPTVLAGRLALRTIDPFSGTSAGEVPLSERLYLGGVHAGRGFPYEKLGPVDSTGSPVGGTSSVLGSVELRFPVWRRFGGAVFVDVGQVALRPFELRAEDFGVGVGPGITIATPIGEIAGYAGYPVRPLGVTPSWQFGLSVGFGF